MTLAVRGRVLRALLALPLLAIPASVRASGFALDLFLQGRESEGNPKPPLALHLEGPDPMALAHAAWESVRAYRG